ncbi:hypothetical protein DL762_006866 [Monosporascus cannonballus]|uniref:NmrA-like domain-containing protein n=1 Tax=Monosporascus cannonballus TaxID=155416 RepID=A0ABY0H571_9PEZI|nr:hypothetical protein DL762_006866 [Monosporascus cannonballus]
MPEASINLTSISIPQHFNRSMYNAVANVALELEPGIVVPWQIRRYYNAVRLAYHLNSCEGFSMDTSTCDIEDGPHLVFFIDYNDAYLELCFADVGEFIITDVTKKTFRDIGARRLVVSSGQDIESYSGIVRAEVQGFVQHYFIEPDSNAHIEDVRAIVLSGDAPPEAFQNIRDIVVSILPGQVDQIRDTLNPLHAGAVGAAEWAKFQALHPEIVKEIISHAMSSDTHMPGYRTRDTEANNRQHVDGADTPITSDSKSSGASVFATPDSSNELTCSGTSTETGS